MAADDLTRRSVMQLTGAAFALPFEPKFLENSRMSFTPRFVDLVRNTVTTVGTGNFVLGPAVTGFTSFATAIQPGESFYYSCAGVSKPAECEVGRGTMQPDGTISRDPISGTPTDFTAGPKTIALIAAAEWFEKVDQAGGGAGSPPVDVADRAALSAVQPKAGSVRFLAENRREGLFKFDASDLSAKVSADSSNGIYVAPGSDGTGASGAWVRQFEGPVNPIWFGVVEGDASGANGAANSAALAAMFAALRSRALVFSGSSTRRGHDAVRFPPGYFEFADTIEITGGNFILEGADTGSTTGHPTVLKFPAGVTGIRVQASDTSGASGGSGANHYNGGGSHIRNLALVGSYADAEAEAHGIQLRARAKIENVFIASFEGDGIYCWATAGSGTVQGNANNSFISYCRIEKCRNGMFIDGADANIWLVEAVDVSNNRQWGICDRGFLGNTYVGCHAATNGETGAEPSPAFVTHGGNRYGAIAGQEAGASTNAPSGTATDNIWWYYHSAGGVGTGFPAWLSGATYRAGGPYCTDGNNAQHVFSGCYSEGAVKAQLTYPTLVVGGVLSNGRVLGLAGVIEAEAGMVSTPNPIASKTVGASSTKTISLGGEEASGTIIRAVDSTFAPSSFRLRFSGNDVRWDYANNNSQVGFWITGPNTTNQFGTGAPVPHAVYVPRLMLGSSIGSARQVFATAKEWAPNFTADGEVFIPASDAMTIEQGNAKIGTGTITFEKSTAGDPATFNSTTLPATLEAGAWLKVVATGVGSFVATHLQRTA